MSIARFIVAVAVAAAGCGGGDATAPRDAATADAAAEALTDAAADVFLPDVPEDATPAHDAAGETGADFVAIAPCPDPGAYVAAAQVTAAVDNRYSPACLRVAAGNTVTIEASAHHPLEPRAGGSPGNPIPSQNAPATVTFPTPGFYPFLCPEHVDQGMIGVVWVM